MGPAASWIAICASREPPDFGFIVLPINPVTESRSFFCVPDCSRLPRPIIPHDEQHIARTIESHNGYPRRRILDHASILAFLRAVHRDAHRLHRRFFVAARVEQPVILLRIGGVPPVVLQVIPTAIGNPVLQTVRISRAARQACRSRPASPHSVSQFRAVLQTTRAPIRARSSAPPQCFPARLWDKDAPPRLQLNPAADDSRNTQIGRAHV